MNHFPLSEQQHYSLTELWVHYDEAAQSHLIYGSFCLSLRKGETRLWNYHSVKQFINRLSIFWRNMNAVTILSLPLWCWSAVGYQGVDKWFLGCFCDFQCCYMVGRVLLWLPGCFYGFSVLLCGCQSISMIIRMFLWLTGCCCCCQDVSLLFSVLLCGCQGVVMVTKVLLCSCQGVSTVNRVLLLLPGCFYGFLCVAMWLPGHCYAVCRVIPLLPR